SFGQVVVVGRELPKLFHGRSCVLVLREEDEGRLKTMTWRRVIGSLPSLKRVRQINPRTEICYVSFKSQPSDLIIRLRSVTSTVRLCSHATLDPILFIFFVWTKISLG
ncbi:hypothetical protein L195_g045763, partial [Trifolium pratense]